MKVATILFILAFSLIGFVFAEEVVPSPVENEIYIEAEGLSFYLPAGFSEVDNPHQGKYAPEFARYYMNEDASLLVRVRKDDWGDEEITETSLYAYSSAYVANSIGEFPQGDEIIVMKEQDYEVINADGGITAIYELSDDQKQIQGFNYEVLAMLMKKPNSVYLISYLFSVMDEKWDKCGQTLFNNLKIMD